MSRTAYLPQMKVINIKKNAVCVVFRSFIPCTLLRWLISVNPFLQNSLRFLPLRIDKIQRLQIKISRQVMRPAWRVLHLVQMACRTGHLPLFVVC